MIKLRDYQEESVSSALQSLKQGKNPLICLPTGSGKSLVLAELARILCKDEKVLIATHRKELIEQDSEALFKLTQDENLYTIYSASCNEKDLTGQVVFAQIQSLHRRENIPSFRYIIIDEAHLIPREGEGMYQTLFTKLPQSQRIGLTATPYRMDSGNLHEGEGCLFDDLCIHIKASELIPEYLSPLVGITNGNQINIYGVHIRRGDFVTNELEQIVCDEESVKKICDEMLRFATERKSILIFATSIQHAEIITEYLERSMEDAALITGSTDIVLREQYLEQFRQNEIRHLVNVGVLTTGVDLPMIDCLVHMRPTASKSLYVQIQGRGMRKYEGKENCLILDFAGNMIRHGGLDDLSEHRNIPEEKRVEEQKKKKKQRQISLYDLDTHSDPLKPNSYEELEVISVKYLTVPAKKHYGLTNVIAEYNCGRIKIKKWLCPEYTSGASWYAHQWLKTRGYKGEKITNSSKFVRMAHMLPTPTSISVAKNTSGYLEIKIEHFE